jgi:hypothetical protein
MTCILKSRMQTVATITHGAHTAALSVCAAGAFFLFTGCSAATLHQAHEEPPACSSRIILTFAQPPVGEPDRVFVTSLANDSGVQLSYLHSAGAGLYVFALASDLSCLDSLERLRRDPRVRSVDIDERRKPQR